MVNKWIQDRKDENNDKDEKKEDSTKEEQAPVNEIHKELFEAEQKFCDETITDQGKITFSILYYPLLYLDFIHKRFLLNLGRIIK